MTAVRPKLMLRRLTVWSKGASVYDECFHKGLNIIGSRTNACGKSTIADLIFLALGGNCTHWVEEALRCDRVVAEVELSGEVVTLRRKISSDSLQPMSIFFGPMDEALGSAEERWREHSYKRSASGDSFSQVIFRALRLPEVRSDTDSNITMHQLLRLMYIDQRSPLDSLLRYERFDTALTRKTIEDLLYGAYDDSLYEKELQLADAQKEYRRMDGNYQALVAIADNSFGCR